MTLCYCSGVLIGFVLNRKITFGFRGDRIGALARYFASYGVGYAINFVGLWLLVDCYGAPHEIVQGGIMAGLVTVLFLLQRYWVFPTRGSHDRARFARPAQ